ncbi:hypothetical protein Tco_1097148, partial [Tanacetum coccineum]
MADLSKDSDGSISQPSEVGIGETLHCSFASKIQNVDGKILGKDGKPMRKAIRSQGHKDASEIFGEPAVGVNVDEE